jgi:hypothetical protein
MEITHPGVSQEATQLNWLPPVAHRANRVLPDPVDFLDSNQLVLAHFRVLPTTILRLPGRVALHRMGTRLSLTLAGSLVVATAHTADTQKSPALCARVGPCSPNTVSILLCHRLTGGGCRSDPPCHGAYDTRDIVPTTRMRGSVASRTFEEERVSSAAIAQTDLASASRGYHPLSHHYKTTIAPTVVKAQRDYDSLTHQHHYHQARKISRESGTSSYLSNGLLKISSRGCRFPLYIALRFIAACVISGHLMATGQIWANSSIRWLPSEFACSYDPSISSDTR